MAHNTVYFDHNATTPVIGVVREAMLELMHEPLNASSVHMYGRKAKGILESARVRISNAIDAGDKYNVVFTSSGTEANNTALRGINGYNVITSVTEHPSVLKVSRHSGLVPVGKDGIVALEELERILSSSNEKLLVSIHAANNETGVIQPVKEICELVHKYGGIFHTDAVQVFGKVPFSLAEIDADLATVSGHKLGGPVGAAALFVRKGLHLQPLMVGGGQELRLRPGTQNIIAIHGFGIAAETAVSNLDVYARLSYLLEQLENGITSVSPGTIVFGKGAARLPNTSSFTMPGVSNETQVIYFDTKGFAISAGSACSSGKVDLPYVQMSMGYSEEEAKNGVRISLGINNTQSEVEKFVALWKELFLKTNKRVA